MENTSIPKNGPILIVGAVVFGLSTALHLGHRDYKNVTVIDMQDYDKTRMILDAMLHLWVSHPPTLLKLLILTKGLRCQQDSSGSLWI